MPRCFAYLLRLCLITLVLFSVRANALSLSVEQEAFLAEHPVIKVSNESDWPPFDFVEQGQPAGYSIDVMHLIAARLGVKFEFVNGYSWQQLLKLAKAQQIDIIHSIQNTPDRVPYLHFSQPFFDIHSVIVSTQQQRHLDHLAALQGHKLAVIKGYAAVDQLRAQYPNIELVYFTSPESALKALALNRVNAYIDNLTTINYLSEKYLLSNLVITGEVALNQFPKPQLRIGVRKDWEILRDIIDLALEDIKEQEWIALRKKWLSEITGGKPHTATMSAPITSSDSATQQVSSLHLLTAEERAYLDNKSVITMCVDPIWPPFEWINPQGEHEGIVADTMALFAKRINKTIQLVPSRSWNQTLAKAKARQCDIISAASATPSRQEYLDFGAHFMKLPVVVITQELPYFIGNIGQLGDKPFGIVAGYSLIEQIQAKYPNANIVEVGNVQKGLEKVANGELFAFIDSVASVSHYIREGKISNVKINGAAGLDWEIGVATRNDEPILREIFDKVTLDISPQEHDAIFNRWINIKFEHEANYSKLWPLLLMILCIIALVIYWNHKLATLNQKINSYLNLINQHVLNLKIDLQARIVESSDAFCEVTGYHPSSLQHSDFLLLFQGENSEAEQQGILEAISQQQSWHGELKYKNKNGSILITETFLSPIKRRDRVTGFSVIQQDITDKKRIENITRIDELTGLFNRRHFNEIFPKERMRAKRDGKLFGFMLIDVDNFKAFNDTYGHPKGDQVLVAIAQTLQHQLNRSCDYTFRLGGEEFGVIVSGAAMDIDIMDIAYRLKEAVENLAITHTANQPYDVITISIGVQILTPDNPASQAVVYQEADDALYQAKHKSRNCVLRSL